MPKAPRLALDADMTSPVLIAAAAVLLGASVAAAASTSIPPHIAAAVAAPERAFQRSFDARRKIGEVIAFTGVKRGDKVLELIPGNGYFTRVFSAAVGPKGRVYAVWPEPYAKQAVPNVRDLRALSAKPPYRNIAVLVQPAAKLTAPEPLDLVFTSQNYHDYPDAFMGRIDPMVFNRAVYRALKPGGTLVVIDHAAAPGSGMRDTDTLHRIDPATVRKQVEAAGFVYAGRYDGLRNPKDDHKLTVFDKPIRGHTDQFGFRFVKPRKAR